ncbi:hypothetical protein AAMO2058_000851800 [Amorphochlora amoebiformis]
MDFKIQDVLELAKEAGRKAGEFVRMTRVKNFVDRQKKGGKVDKFVIKSSTTDVVTETDHKSELMITKMIRSKYPKHKIIGEESSSEGYDLTKSPTWIIDPIDGTTNFLHGFPYTCVLISFAYEMEILAGVLYDPIHSEMFYATKGGGCHMESKDYTGKLTTSAETDLKTAYILTDAGYGRSEKDVTRFYSRLREYMTRRVQGLRVLGSCGLNMAYVACGRADGYVEEGCPKIWDFAAGCLMVREAGGFVCMPDGKEFDLMGRSVLCAASKELGNTLLECVGKGKKYEEEFEKQHKTCA